MSNSDFIVWCISLLFILSGYYFETLSASESVYWGVFFVFLGGIGWRMTTWQKELEEEFKNYLQSKNV